MGDWYLVVKKIKGRAYHYRQKTEREGAHVRTLSQYLGPADAAPPVHQQRRPGSRPAALSEAEAVALWDRGELGAVPAIELPEDVRGALRAYGSTRSDAMNAPLRAGFPPDMPEHDLGGLFRLAEAFEDERSSLKADVRLYRRALVQGENPLQIGHDFRDDALMSFSVSLLAALNHRIETIEGMHTAILVLNVRKGDRGYIAMNGVETFSAEKEVLRTGGRFIVVDCRQYDKDTLYYIEEIGIK